MVAIYVYMISLFTFVIGAGILGFGLRTHRSEEAAKMHSHVIQSLFYFGLVLPPKIAVFYPGLTHLDGLIGLPFHAHYAGFANSHNARDDGPHLQCDSPGVPSGGTNGAAGNAVQGSGSS
jgi:hypothetical protein